jgi:hypothetical protein
VPKKHLLILVTVFAADQYQPLEAKMKRVMERELTDIVEEER